jgi:hypothetical protein
VTDVIWYLTGVIHDGDYQNDYLSHLPTTAAWVVGVFGWIIALITGG